MKKEIIHNIRNTMKVFAVGGTALLMGVGASLLFYLSVCLFLNTKNLTGYMAVGVFTAAVIALTGAVAGVYLSGCWIIRKGKFAR